MDGSRPETKSARMTKPSSCLPPMSCWTAPARALPHCANMPVSVSDRCTTGISMRRRLKTSSGTKTPAETVIASAVRESPFIEAIAAGHRAAESKKLKLASMERTIAKWNLVNR